MMILRRIDLPLLFRDADQHEPEAMPAEGVAPIAVIPVVEHGVPRIDDGADGLAVGISGMGLSPPTPSSVEPIGMPTRPTADDDAIPVGDEAEAAGCPDAALVTPAHVPEVVPTLPPPSNSVDEADVPGVDIPVPTELPVIEPVPNRFPACELMPLQVALLSAPGPSGDTPEVIGLTPGELSSVAPRGMPVPATAGAEPMPSGEVMPSGEGALPGICAKAEPQPSKIVAVAIITRRVMLTSCPAS
jgi:hypothetical protein